MRGMIRAQKKSGRRPNQRHTFETAVRYRPEASGAPSAWKRGLTVDMSATDVTIRVPERMAPGSRWELEMDWTGLYHGKPAMRLHLTASVVRATGNHIGLRILNHEFRETAPVARCAVA
jgi:hypothetical protein